MSLCTKFRKINSKENKRIVTLDYDQDNQADNFVKINKSGNFFLFLA